MPKKPYNPAIPPECGKSSLGVSPASLKKRSAYKTDIWCPPLIPHTKAVDYDHWCDRCSPKTVLYKDVVKAHNVIKGIIDNTPLLVSKMKAPFDMNLYFKLETLHECGSFHQRSAIYALHKLTDEEKKGGVYTASTGNWGMALASVGNKMHITVTVFIPMNSNMDTIRRLEEYGAIIMFSGQSLTEARLEAFNLIKQRGCGTYINGYDHPHVIAGAGSIGIELLEQLPDTDAIIIPVGGGGLLAGITTAVKTLKPDTLIYGVESYESCCFFKAMDNEGPYTINCDITAPLAVPTAGYNAFHTARSLVDKLVLVENKWINQAVLKVTEQERLILEFSSAVALAAILTKPYLVPELRDKNVVCIVTGANVACMPLCRALEHGLAFDGRRLTIKICLRINKQKECSKILRIIGNLGANIINFQSENVWSTEDDLMKFYVREIKKYFLTNSLNTLQNITVMVLDKIPCNNIIPAIAVTVMCSTESLQHTCTLKRVIEKLFPKVCEFSEEPFCGETQCPCYPKLWSL